MDIVKGVALKFSQAFSEIRRYPFSLAMRLPKWNPDVRIRVQEPDRGSRMTHRYLYVESRYGRVPWIPTQVELFSTEWQVVEFHEDKPA